MNTRGQMDRLEARRLLAEVSLVIDDVASPVSVTATLNGASLTPNSQTQATTLSGSIAASVTGRGVKLLGGDIDLVGVTGGATYVFDIPGGGAASVVAPTVVLTTSRVPATGNKFSARRISVGFSNGDVSFNGSVVADLADYNAQFEYSIARVKSSASAVRLTVPMNFTAATSFTFQSVPYTLNVAFAGTLVAVGSFVTGASVSSLTAMPAIPSPAQMRVRKPIGGEILSGEL